MVTDAISDYFFVTEESGIENLVQEGKPKNSIYFVGNIMIDNLSYQLDKLNDDYVKRFSMYELKQREKDYVFLTLHRPSDVDSRESFEEIASALNYIAATQVDKLKKADSLLVVKFV